MINSHQFQQAAKQFRAGRISLKEFTDLVMRESTPRLPNEESKKTNPPTGSELNRDCLPTILPQRRSDSHKGDFGRVLAIGGSTGMAGAIGLSGLAALRAGAGMVKVVLPDPVQSTVAALCPCLMTVGCSSRDGSLDESSRAQIVAESDWADVVALGPGLGRRETLQSLVQNLYASLNQPMVVDADGLNVLSDAEVPWNLHSGLRVLTPHPGEFQRIVDRRFTNRAAMEESAKELASAAGLVVVLKGSRTFVTDGQRIFHNRTGNAGMATAGSGDVLTGVIASLLGQGLAPFDAAVLGVHIHGSAGDLGAETTGETSLIATDIIDHLGFAFKKHARQTSPSIGFQAT